MAKKQQKTEKFTFKDALLLGIAVILGLVALRADDPVLVIPMLIVIWILLIVLCYRYMSQFSHALTAALIIGAVLGFAGFRALHASQKEVEVSNIELRLAKNPGETTAVFVRLKVNTERSFAIRRQVMVTAMPFYRDPTQQKRLENLLWTGFTTGKGMGETSDVPVGEQVGFPMYLHFIPAPTLAVINSGQWNYYFLVRMTKEDGTPVLEMCFHANSDETLQYCFSHNEPGARS